MMQKQTSQNLKNLFPLNLYLKYGSFKGGKGIASLLIIAVFLLNACKKEITHPSTAPVVSLISISKLKNEQGKDSLITIAINYKDINGDIGLEENDTNGVFNVHSKYFFNFIVDYYIDKSGVWEKFELSPGDTLDYNQRLPTLTPTGKDKSINGTITYPILASPYPGIEPKKIKMDIYMYDRDLNTSNVLSPIVSLDF